MIAERVLRDTLGTRPLTGLVVAADVRDADGRVSIHKGSILQEGDVLRLRALPWTELHLLALEPGDVHELQAGARLARAVAGPGVEVGDVSGGQWSLRARQRGVLQLNVGGLAAINTCPDLSLYTLFDGQVVETGETVARAKIIPFVIAESVVALGERRAAEATPIVTVRAFQPRRVAALVQESLAPRAAARFRAVFGEKVAWFGGELDEPRFVASRLADVQEGLDALLATGPALLVVAGSRAMDPLDPVFEALPAVGASMIRRGMPAHPGSLCWVARRDETTIIGMPSCGVFSQATVFDLLLTWVFAGVDLDATRLAQFGHGGFLTRDMAFRFPPYRQSGDRGEVE